MSVRQRIVALGVASGLAAASLTGAPAAWAATSTITDATFEWAFNDTVQFVAGPCHYMSAGTSSANEATYRTSEGDVSIVKAGGTPTWANKCTTDPTTTRINQKVVWRGGQGSVDAATGASTIAFAGTLSLNYNSSTPIRITDPVLTVDGAGAGTLTATVSGYAAGTTPTTYAAQPGVVVATFNRSASGAGYTGAPQFSGKSVTINGSPQPTAALQADPALNPSGQPPLWGAWPQSWATYVNQTGNGPFFWTTSTAATQARKAPVPFTVTYGAAAASGTQAVSVRVPAAGNGQFVMSIEAGDRVVTMSSPSNQGSYLQSTGRLKQVTVTDTRPTRPAWSVSGQAGDFDNGLSGRFLGWTPTFVGAAPTGTILGGTVAPGTADGAGVITGNGLTSASPLGSATAGHDLGTTVFGADLDLRIPPTTAAATYTAMLTVTAVI